MSNSSNSLKIRECVINGRTALVDALKKYREEYNNLSGSTISTDAFALLLLQNKPAAENAPENTQESRGRTRERTREHKSCSSQSRPRSNLIESFKEVPNASTSGCERPLYGGRAQSPYGGRAQSPYGGRTQSRGVMAGGRLGTPARTPYKKSIIYCQNGSTCKWRYGYGTPIRVCTFEHTCSKGNQCESRCCNLDHND